MKNALLLILTSVILMGCLSFDAKPSPASVSGIIDDLSDYDLPDSAQEALAIGSVSGTKEFTYIGLGLFTVGALLFATIARDSGIKLMLCGVIAGSVPYVVQSSYFNYIVSIAGIIVVGMLIHHLWWKIRKSEVSE
jgi:hypothetical protein